MPRERDDDRALSPALRVNRRHERQSVLAAKREIEQHDIRRIVAQHSRGSGDGARIAHAMSGFLQQQSQRADDEGVVLDEQDVRKHSGRAAHRNREEEAAPRAEGALHPEASVVQLDELARDREAESRAVMLPRRGRVDLREFAEDEIVMLGRDADARCRRPR